MEQTKKNYAKKNDVFIIGTLVEVKTDVRTSQTGKTYISGKIATKVELDGVENIIEARIFAFEKTKNDTDNKLFKAYSTLEALKGKRVRIQGSLNEGHIVDESTGDVRHFNQIDAKFISAAYTTDTTDKASFEYSGFVTRAIYERKDKEDNLLGYRLEVAQSNWNDSNIIVIRFDVDKNDTVKAAAIENAYMVGSTVSFSGVLTSVVTIVTKTEECDFGDPVVKTFAQNDKAYRITSGNNPLSEDDPSAYDDAAIKTFVAAYKKSIEELVEAKQTAAQTSAVESSPAAAAMNAVTRKATPSLI